MARFLASKASNVFAYLAWAWTSNILSPFLRVLGVREPQCVVQRLPNARKPFGRQKAADRLVHQGITVCPTVLGQLELARPLQEDHVPTADRRGVETRRGVGDEGGVVGANRGAYQCRVLGGGGLKTSSQGSSTANPKWASNRPPPKKKGELATRGDLLLLKRLLKVFEQRVKVGGSRWVALGSTLACFLSGAFKRERSWGRPRWRGGTRSSRAKARSSSWSAPPATMPPPPIQDMERALFTQFTVAALAGEGHKS